MNRTKNQNGYVTVEATLVVTVVFFSLLFIIFIGILLFQQVKFQSLAFQSASRGTAIYNRLNTDNINSGLVKLADFSKRDPYRYIWDTKTSGKEQVINTFVASKVNSNNLREADSTPQSIVDIKNNVISKKAYVSVEADYAPPISGISKMFGIKSPLEINARASSTVSDPVELIRNTDLVIDMLKSVDVVNDKIVKLSEIKNKINEFSNILKLE